MTVPPPDEAAPSDITPDAIDSDLGALSAGSGTLRAQKVDWQP